MRNFALVAVCAASLVACASDPAPGAGADCPDGAPRTVTVLAASSLAAVFGDLRGGFLEANPCLDEVVFSFGSSATLAAQVVNGSPADVFVSASRATMDIVAGAGLATGEPRVFARNDAAIMVSVSARVADRIGAVADLVDAPGRAVTAGLCVASAPCGALADEVLAKAATMRSAVADTEASSLEDLVTKIELGELDAGIVYGSDCARRSETVRCVPIPAAQNAVTEYHVVALTDTPGARAWLAYIESDDVVAALVGTYGFGAP